MQQVLAVMAVLETARQKLEAPRDLWHLVMIYTSAFERSWQPYLDGKAPFEQALHDLVQDAR